MCDILQQGIGSTQIILAQTENKRRKNIYTTLNMAKEMLVA